MLIFNLFAIKYNDKIEVRQIVFKAFSFISVMSAVIDSQAQVDHFKIFTDVIKQACKNEKIKRQTY